MTASSAEGRVRILGLDPSLTSFGVAMLEIGIPTDLHTETWGPKLTGVRRLEWFFQKIQKTLVEFRPNMVMLEGYAYGVSRGNAAVSMGELGAAVRLALHWAGAEPVVVPPAKLKKFITGKGNAGKDVMMLEAYKRFGIDVPTSDETDAAGLAYMAAVGRYGLWPYVVDLPKANRESLEGIEWPW